MLQNLKMPDGLSLSGIFFIIAAGPARDDNLPSLRPKLIEIDVPTTVSLRPRGLLVRAPVYSLQVAHQLGGQEGNGQ